VTYTEWKKYDDAEELAKKVETQHPDEIESTTELLMEIYEKTGETSKQKEYQEKLDKIRDLKNNETDGK
jgi:two-component SAPR family response regulator